ncbi:Aldo/keto reductase [Trema orientale]|uniref:Aldo/keto reductase n=1 Tax=Trema orientale TaxID=63057 RepID=A0A2P5EDZ6_TREOI|nr:Aldo/keto reductase [Trema orientale]
MAKIPEVILRSCEKAMPVVGMGTSSYPQADLETGKAAILEAIKAGYRHFDTAFVYGSEQHIGKAIAEALSLGLIKSRDELFITTKLFASFAERDLVVPAIKMSLSVALSFYVVIFLTISSPISPLKTSHVRRTRVLRLFFVFWISKLELDYVDMYIIHWPFKLSKEVKSMPVEKELIQPLDIKSVWEGMEDCKKLGLAKGIGVSNFTPQMLEELLSLAKIPPAVNQVEMSPIWQQKKLREFCEAKGIHITAYSPLGASGTKWGDNRVIGCDVLEEIANAKGKTTAQIALRWVYEQGVSLVTKSYNKERMRKNVDIFDWCLTQQESEKISQLPQRKTVTFASIVGPHDLVLQIDQEI